MYSLYSVPVKIFRDGPEPACNFHLVCRRCLRPQKWSPAMQTVHSLPLLMGISVAVAVARCFALHHANSQDEWEFQDPKTDKMKDEGIVPYKAGNFLWVSSLT